MMAMPKNNTKIIHKDDKEKGEDSSNELVL